MAKIYNSEVNNEIRNAAKIQVGSDFVPDLLSNQVVAVMEVNPKIVKNAFIKSGTSAATGAVSLYTTPTAQDFYLCSVAISYSKNAACDIATGNIGINVQINGAVVSVIGLSVQTLTAESGYLCITFPHPIKVDRAYSMTLSGTFTAGALVRWASISGFIDESSAA